MSQKNDYEELSTELSEEAEKARRGLVDSKNVCEINNLKVSELSGSPTIATSSSN